MKILPILTNHFVANSPLYAFGQMHKAAASTYVFNGVSRKPTLDVEYGGRFFIDEANFPNNTGIQWLAPASPPQGGVGGYLCIGRNRMWNTQVSKRDPIKPLSSVLETIVSWDLDYIVTPGGDANILIDVMPYAADPATPAPGGTVPPVMELSIFPSIGDAARVWAAGLPPIRKGTVTIDGVKWNTRRSGVNCIFYLDPGVEMLKGSVDLKPFWDFLQGAGLADEKMLYVGLQFGVEPNIGGGHLRINELSLGAG